MIDFKIIDSEFAHAKTFGNGDLNISPSNFLWYRGNEYRDICFFTDNNLLRIADRSITRGKINIAWLLEPPSIRQYTYDWIYQNYDLFDYVLTYNKKLLQLDKKIVWYPHAGCWIYSKDFKIYNKSKNIVMIASNKVQTQGHKFRHNIIDKLHNKIDFICGRGYNSFNYKLDVLKDYRYSIIVENGIYDTYFTEKIIDCFVTGTIPIYWGCSLNNIFDERGILYFNTIEELNNILDKINTNEIKYENMLEYVNNNFEISKQYVVTEDWIFDNFITKLR